MASITLHMCLWLTLIHSGAESTLVMSSGRQISVNIIEKQQAETRPTAKESKTRSLVKSSLPPKKTPSPTPLPTNAKATNGSSGAANAYSNYVAEIRNIIFQKKTYPEYSRRLKEYGRVKLEVIISADGQIQAVEILESCPFQRLNTAALALVKNIGQFKPFPPDLVAHQELKFEIPLEYVIR